MATDATDTTVATISELITAEHLPTLVQHLKSSEGVFLCRYAPDHTIVTASQGFIEQLPPTCECLGESINRYLADPDGRACSLLSTDRASLPVSFTVRVRPSERTYLCYLYNDDDGYLLIGERLAESENETVQRMSLMTNELASLTLELRRRNSELEEANDTIRQLTRVDTLTGLPNRRHFAEALDTAMTMARRHRQPLSLIAIDIDRFKSVNDTYGHDVGDEVLQNFALIVKESCRNEDLPVRIGGEEFLILAPSTVVDEAYTLAERLRERIANSPLLDKGRRITSSFGVTQLLENDTYFQFMKRADMALYEAKSGGRNKTVVRMTNALAK